jgi:tRNA(Ile2) C34 agmatinyltransferase TiaS
MPVCKDCGEQMEGDGYTTVLHCPYAEEDYDTIEPDANPVYCGFSDDETE